MESSTAGTGPRPRSRQSPPPRCASRGIASVFQSFSGNLIRSTALERTGNRRDLLCSSSLDRRPISWVNVPCQLHCRLLFPYRRGLPRNHDLELVGYGDYYRSVKLPGDLTLFLSLTQLSNRNALCSLPQSGRVLIFILTTPHVHLDVTPELHEQDRVDKTNGHGTNCKENDSISFPSNIYLLRDRISHALKLKSSPRMWMITTGIMISTIILKTCTKMPTVSAIISMASPFSTDKQIRIGTNESVEIYQHIIFLCGCKYKQTRFGLHPFPTYMQLRSQKGTLGPRSCRSARRTTVQDRSGCRTL